MSSTVIDDNYIAAKEKSALILKDPIGLSNHVTPSQTEQIIIKQNNTIIELLVALHQKIDKLTKQPSTTIQKTDIEKLTEQMANMKTIEPKARKFLVTEYKFGYKK